MELVGIAYPEKVHGHFHLDAETGQNEKQARSISSDPSPRSWCMLCRELSVLLQSTSMGNRKQFQLDSM